MKLTDKRKKTKIVRTKKKPKNSGRKKRAVSKQVSDRVKRQNFAERLRESEAERKHWAQIADRLELKLDGAKETIKRLQAELDEMKMNEAARISDEQNEIP